MSHSWNAFVPISVLDTCPVMQTSGVESIAASAIGVTRFVAPGPEVASTTPTGPRGARVALRHVAGALLVADEDVSHRRAARDRVVDRQDRPAGHAEAHLDALGLHDPEDQVGAEHLWCHLSVVRFRAGLREHGAVRSSSKGQWRATGELDEAPPRALVIDSPSGE